MQKIIYLYGPSCSGKSTIASELLSQSDLEHVHSDILKWEILDYSRDDLDHRKKIQKQMISLIEQKLREGKSLLVEGLWIELFEEVKNTHEPQTGVFAIKVIADKEILIKRFKERVERAKHSTRKISNTSLDVFLQLYEKYNSEPELGITINTSDISISESLARVKTYLSLPH